MMNKKAHNYSNSNSYSNYSKHSMTSEGKRSLEARELRKTAADRLIDHVKNVLLKDETKAKSDDSENNQADNA